MPPLTVSTKALADLAQGNSLGSSGSRSDPVKTSACSDLTVGVATNAIRLIAQPSDKRLAVAIDQLTEVKDYVAGTAVSAVEKIEKLANRFIELATEFAPIKFYREQQVGELKGYVIQAAESAKQVYQAATGELGDVTKATLSIWDKLKIPSTISFVTKHVDGLALFAVPVGIYEFYRSAKRCFVHDSASKKIDSALLAIITTSELTTAAITISEFLCTVGAIARTSLSWVASLTIVGTVLSVATVFLNVKRLWNSHQFLNKVENTYANPEKGVDASLALFTEKGNSIQHRLGVKRGLLEEPIKKTAHAAKEKKTALQGLLVGRLKTMIKSQRVALVASIIAAIGSVLLFAGPAAPVGYGLLALAGAIYIGRFVYDKVQEQRFRKALAGEETELVEMKPVTDGVQAGTPSKKNLRAETP